MGDALIEAVVESIANHAIINRKHLGHATVKFAATFMVDRLRAGGISDLVIAKCLCGDGHTVVEKHWRCPCGAYNIPERKTCHACAEDRRSSRE